MERYDPRLQEIAALLESQLEEELEGVSRQIAHVDRLRRVAEALNNSGVLGELSARAAELGARLQGLLEARQALRPPSGELSVEEAPATPAPPEVTEALRQVASSTCAAPLTPPRPASGVRPPPAASPGGHTGPRVGAPTCPPAAVADRGDIELPPARSALPPQHSPRPAAPPSLRSLPPRHPPAPAPAPAKKASPPQWTPRPLDDLESERKLLLEDLAGVGSGEAGLTTFKRLCCRFRGAWEERERHPGAQDDWRAALGAFKEAQRENWPNAYCIPLVPDVRLEPAAWREFAERFDRLKHAVAAQDWLESSLPTANPQWLGRDALPLLESIGACWSLVARWFVRSLPDRKDPQHGDLYQRLVDLAKSRGVYIRTLQREVPDEEILVLAGHMASHLEGLQSASEKRNRQSAALEQFESLLREPVFGTGDDDDDRLCEIARECMAAGIPASDRRLRDALIDYAWMIEDDPALERLLKAVRAELERRESRAAEPRVDDQGAEHLPADLRAKLREILPETRGRRGLIVGGVCREANRQAIQEALELRDLRWPSTEPTDPFERSEREIARADLVFLTRFNRKSSNEAVHLCREESKPLIRLPKGYGLHEVIMRTHGSLFRRE